MRKGGVERPSWPNPGTLQDPFSNLLCSHREEMDKDIPYVALIQGPFVVGGRRPRSYFYLHQAFFYSYD
uniref:ORF68b n=1 Tax=Pinus koraiensis TaxID=88728 RepID=Q85WV8_PINKO|nr:ORF68b [Pinus koraiensis]AAO74111.1 ORF68b [Pinus koraiensis]